MIDKTVEIVQAFAAIQAAANAEAIAEAHDAGVAAAHAATAATESFFVMDENGFNELQNAYGIGWNSTWFPAKAANA